MSETSAPLQTFEQSLAELERVVQCLEDGGSGLEESLDLYEKGVGLLKLCYTQLRKAEQRINVLVNVDDANQPQVQPFEHQASAPEKRPGRRRTTKNSEDDELPL